MEKERDRSYMGSLGVQNPEGDYADHLTELLKARGKFSQDKLQCAAAAAADGLTAALDEPFMTAFERYKAHMDNIGKRERGGVYPRSSPATARGRDRARTFSRRNPTPDGRLQEVL